MELTLSRPALKIEEIKMSNKKTVSIWTANADWQQSTVREIVTPAYSDDGESRGSEFSNAFSLGFIDDDFIEADIVEPTKHMEEAVEDFSYDSEIADEIKKRNISPLSEKINTIIAIYDYAYEGKTTTSKLRGIEFTYRGQFKYEN